MKMRNTTRKHKEKPEWLKIRLPGGENFEKLLKIIDQHKLHTICASGRCPNMGECWSKSTATFLILGNICTRSCGFCNVLTGKPLPADLGEPEKVAESIKLMGVKHAVITSVDRDDLPDGGSKIWAETVKAIRKHNPVVTIETLIPDFQGKTELLDNIIAVAPEVVSHNLETVKRLTKQVRKQAKYERSLGVLKYLKGQGVRRTKSGLMLGLGETQNEVIESMQDLRNINVDIITIGQYLQPSSKHLSVERYITPAEFKKYKIIGLNMGFKHVESGPLVRSSYHAYKHLV